MIEAIRQAGMIFVLVLLSEGFFVLSGVFRSGDARVNRSAAAVDLLAGAIICSSALMLLYSLGTRDEK